MNYPLSFKETLILRWVGLVFPTMAIAIIAALSSLSLSWAG